MLLEGCLDDSEEIADKFSYCFILVDGMLAREASVRSLELYIQISVLTISSFMLASASHIALAKLSRSRHFESVVGDDQRD